jgi:uncharacterized protein (TIGR00730 family)
MAESAPLSRPDSLSMAQQVLSYRGRDLRSLLLKDILVNGLKCQSDDLDVLDLKVINRALAEFRHAARIFKPYRNVRKVSMFGSARISPHSTHYRTAVAVGRLLAGAGFMVITGAADGIMRAGIEGAGAANSFGVNILLPFEQGANDLIRDDPKVMRFKYFFTRKVFFVMEADAVVLFPGGFGTHDEGFEVLTLLQTGKAPPMPVVLVELPGEDYWDSWDQFVRHQLLERRLISPADRSFYHIVHSPEEAVDRVTSYYRVFHSLRQVGDQLVIRLERELAEGDLAKLTSGFADIIEDGEIEPTGPLPDENDEPALLAKPRIVFRYNHKSAGRLNELVWKINEIGGY